jgi:hypothetical protein
VALWGGQRKSTQRNLHSACVIIRAVSYLELPMPSRTAVRRVIGPDGSVLTEANLPSAATMRWVASRKAVVVAAVRGGLLSLEDACRRYRLTAEEYLSWQTQVDRHGLMGLRATYIQDYRSGVSLVSSEARQ